MPEHAQTVGWIALWPLPFALGALLCAAYGWPRGDNAISAGAAVLTFSVLYALIMVIGRLVQHSFTPRAMFIATAIGVVYHLVAFSLPRSEGFVQLGFGDLMIAGGGLVYMGVGELAAPLRRSALERPVRLERALTTEDSARFRVISAAEDADGWVLFGRLQGPDGMMVWQVVRLRTPMAIESTVVDSSFLTKTMALDDGAVHALSDDAILTASPGIPPQTTALPAATIAWLNSKMERVAVYDNRSWLVLLADGSGGSVGRIGPNGALTEEPVKLDITNGDPHNIVRMGNVIYALTEHINQPHRWVLHVIEDGARDDARSEMLTAAIEGQGLGTPIKIIASASRLWLFAYDESSGSRVAIALPDGAPVPIGPGSMTDVIKDGDDLIVATHRHILRVRPEGAEVLGDGWIPKGMLSARDHHASAAVKERRSPKITLTTFEDGKAHPFLPQLRLEAQ